MLAERADAVAQTVIDEFDKLPKNCKPRSNGDGTREWVPLAGIVAQSFDTPDTDTDTDTRPPLTCVALATGMKCVSASVVESSQGQIIHDSHAEVLAIRAFNRLLLEQVSALLDGTSHRGSLQLLERVELCSGPDIRPFRLRPGIRLYMYCSECPCGDASMELVMSRQDDPTPWPDKQTNVLSGRGHFGHLGIVRRKPARPDAPSTSSKSCSDKLALKQATSLLSCVSALYISAEGIYLHALVVPAADHHPIATDRAFGTTGRLADLQGWSAPGGYSFRPFTVLTAAVAFPFSRTTPGSALVHKPTERACFYFPSCHHVLINGVLQGRRQSDVRGASLISRRQMLDLSVKIDATIQYSSPVMATEEPTLMHVQRYRRVKDDPRLAARRHAKVYVISKTLSPWYRSDNDRDWEISF